jgi:SAM-dependent methyltransferase
MNDAVDSYVFAHGGDLAERRRLELLERFHGPLTVSQLTAAGVGQGWRCLEAGAGVGSMTSWLAERVGPGGHVLAIDLETQWLAPLQSETLEVRKGDITTTQLPRDSFDLVLARMLLLHLPDPAQACRQLVAAAAPGGSVIIQDADFTTVTLEDATDAEAEGLDVMAKTMTAAGVHIALGPQLGHLLQAAGAELEHVEVQPSPGHGGQPAALITAITLERFRERAVLVGASSGAIDAAIAALNKIDRGFTGPTQWIVRATAQ